MCALGYQADPLTSKCVQCPLNYYKDFAGTDQCVECDSNEETEYIGSTTKDHCLCRPGTYRHKTTRVCTPCPVGATCEGASKQPYAQSGYYQSDVDNLVFLNCRVGSVCSGSSLCESGYTGVSCGDCKPGHFRIDVHCYYCTGTAKIMWIVYIIVMSVLLMSMYVRSYKTKGGMVLGGAVIAINTLQALGILSRVAVNWPADLLWMLRSFSFFYVNPQMFAPECYFEQTSSFYDIIIRCFAIPVACYAIIWTITLLFTAYSYLIPLLKKCITPLNVTPDSNVFVYVMPCNCISCSRRLLFDTPSERMHILYAAFRTSSVLLWLVVPLVFSSALELFSCRQQLDGTVTLTIAPATECYTDEWKSAVPYALGSVFVFCMLLPCVFAYSLYKTHSHQYSPSVFYSLSFIYERYVRKYWYWEGVQLLRRMALVALVVIFETEVHLLVLLVVVLQVVLGLIHSKYAPYRWAVHNVFEVTADCMLAVTLMVGNVFASKIDDDRVTLGMIIVVYILLLFLFGSVVVLVVYELRLAKDEIKVDGIRKETMMAMDEMADLGSSSSQPSRRMYATDFDSIAPNVNKTTSHEMLENDDTSGLADATFGSTPRSFHAEVL